jgi:hypothetical protein
LEATRWFTIQIIRFKRVHYLENYSVICILQYFVNFIFLTNFTSNFLNLKILNLIALSKSFVCVRKESGVFGVGLNSFALIFLKIKFRRSLPFESEFVLLGVFEGLIMSQ